MSAFIINQIKIVSDYGDSRILPIVVTLALFLFLVEEKYIREGFILLFSVASGIYATVLKLIFKEPRPPMFHYNPYLLGDMYSFPSSHVVFYTAFWGFVFYLTFKLKKVNYWVITLMRLVCIYFVSLVGISRVLVGAHYVQDVIAGYFFGGLYLTLLICADRFLPKVWKKYKKHHES